MPWEQAPASRRRQQAEYGYRIHRGPWVRMPWEQAPSVTAATRTSTRDSVPHVRIWSVVTVMELHAVQRQDSIWLMTNDSCPCSRQKAPRNKRGREGETPRSATSGAPANAAIWRRRSWRSGNRSLCAGDCILRRAATPAKGSQRDRNEKQRNPSHHGSAHASGRARSLERIPRTKFPKDSITRMWHSGTTLKAPLGRTKH